jgi:dipeptidyl aminopeptidase/acylaminoacyl peptidase
MVVLAACSGSESAGSQSAGSQSAGSKKAAELKIIETEILPFDGRAFIASPDGQLMAVVNDNSVCVRKLDGTGSEKCGGETLPAEVLSIRWSPDSKWLTFHERYVEIGQNRGAYVLKADTATLTTLTEDNPSGSEAPDSDTIVDLFPSFTPDSTTVVFWRIDRTSEMATIMSVPAKGGAPSPLATDVSIPASGVDGQVTVTELSLLFARKNATDVNRGDAEIFQAGRDGSGLKQITRGPGKLEALDVRSVSKVLDIALVADGNQMDGWNEPTNPFSTLNLTTGVLTPLTSTTGTIVGAVFSPSGEQLMLVVDKDARAPKSTDIVAAVRDGVDGPDVVLTGVGEFVGLNDAGGHSLKWLQGNKILIANSFNKAIAYQLG